MKNVRGVRKHGGFLREAAVILGVFIAMGSLSACVVSDSGAAGNSTEAAPTSQTATSVLVDKDLGMISNENPALPIRVQWPIVESHPLLAASMAKWAEQKVNAFIATYPENRDKPSELNGSGEQLLDGDVVAARLTINEFGGANWASESKTFFSDKESVWLGSDLIAQDRKRDLSNVILNKLAVEHDVTGINPGDLADNPDIFSDVLVDNGQLHIRLPQASVVSSSAGVIDVDVPAEGFLSEKGKRTSAVASKVSLASDSSLQKATQQPVPSVDCAVLKCVALTFDDGPGPYTNQILDTLGQHGVKATFFETGKSIPRFPDIVRRQIASGMEIGSHTVTHRQLTLLSQDEQQKEADGASQRLIELGAPRPLMLRPPYGSWNNATKNLGYSLILWNVDSEDWKNRDATVTTNNIMAQVKAGSIVLMHDIHPSTAQALPGIILKLKEQGYTLVTVSELIGTPVAGQVYYGR